MKDIQKLKNPKSQPPVSIDESWPDEMLPLGAELDEPAPFPVGALPKCMRDFAEVLRRTTQAPDGIIGGSLLAAASLATQAHANVRMPHGDNKPLSLFIVSIAESGERKSAVDTYALRPHKDFEREKQEQYKRALNDLKALPKSEREGAEEPRQAIFLAGDPTVEGLFKLPEKGLQSVGLFSAEGGRFIGGHAMQDENQLRTATGLSAMWDGGELDRVRSGDGATKLYGRRVALHLMVQPRAALSWLANPLLKDQGLFSRCLVGYPASTAGTRKFRHEEIDRTPEYGAYCAAMTKLLTSTWVTNEFGELEPRVLTLERAAHDRWVALHDEIEATLAKGNALEHLKGFGSKCAEQAARIAGVFQLVRNQHSAEVSERSMVRAAKVLEWYIGEALRLAGARPQREGSEKAELLWSWLAGRGKRHVCMAELTQFGPARLREAKVMRATMQVLEAHYRVRPLPEGVEWERRLRKEAWEVRL
jgi:hypothetical protein